VAEFKAKDFGASLGMSAEDAARIFAALEAPDVGWVAYEYVADFFQRNPDHQDNTATERKRRQRARVRAMKEIAVRFHRGDISAEQRAQMEAQVLLDARLSTGGVSQRDTRDLLTTSRGEIRPEQSQAVTELSTGHAVTHRDIVTVTPEQSKKETPPPTPVDNFGGEASRAAQDQQAEETTGGGQGNDPQAEQAEAELWLLSEGKKLLIDRMQIVPTLAETYLGRWQRDLNDSVKLKNIITGADEAGYVGPRFHTLITDQVRRTRNVAPRLPLGPVGIDRKRAVGEE
jgi:hypothetical protein